jgi:hypothetical protein
MIKVTIGQDAKVDSEISSSWITDQVTRKRAAAGSVCARVQIDEDRIHLTLTTPGCDGAPSTPRPLNAEERQLLNNWARFHLDTSDFAASELAAFVRPFIH